MDIIERLNSFVRWTGLSSGQFADTIGVPRPSLSQILNGRNKKISNDFIDRLHRSFPQLNVSWLLFGEGTMTVSDNWPSGGERIASQRTPLVEPTVNSLNDLKNDSQEEAASRLFEENKEGEQRTIVADTFYVDDISEESKDSPSPSADSDQGIPHSSHSEYFNTNNNNTTKQYHVNQTATNDDGQTKQKAVSKIVLIYTDDTFKILLPSQS
ncbi:MAG: hypothetical protein J1F20_02885 [Muribaculaceae bacterium]|nr:hypothetical protein [Muribaculaceae bacterium]